MKELWSKLVEQISRLSKRQLIFRFGIACTALFILLCISIIIHVNIQVRYSRAVEGMTEQIFQKLSCMEELFSYVDADNIDVEHKLIPQLKGQYTAAYELNQAIVNNYGAKYAVLSTEEIEEFDSAFKEYADAFSAGLSTNLARDDMAIQLALIQDRLNARYNPTPDPTTTPVVIDPENQ